MNRRVPIKVHPRVRETLALLLYDDFEGTGIGYSAVIHAAITLASEQGKAGAAFRDMIQQSQIAVTIYDGQDATARDTANLIREGGSP